MIPEKGPPRRSHWKSHWIVLGLVALVGAGLEIYAQTRAFAWDEGFHLVAAQSINRGKRPYLDFCFPQTPLNAYWNAGWMRVFGDTWRTPHGVAAVMTALAVLLTGGYVLRRFPEPGWRLAAAVTGVCAFGLNVQVVEFGAIAQAYALCLFLIVTAFLLTVAAVDRERPWSAAAAGFLASAAANATLLTAPVAPVLLVWMLFCNRAGSRWDGCSPRGRGRRFSTSSTIICSTASANGKARWRITSENGSPGSIRRRH